MEKLHENKRRLVIMLASIFTVAKHHESQEKLGSLPSFRHIVGQISTGDIFEDVRQAECKLLEKYGSFVAQPLIADLLDVLLERHRSKFNIDCDSIKDMRECAFFILTVLKHDPMSYSLSHIDLGFGIYEFVTKDD